MTRRTVLACCLLALAATAAAAGDGVEWRNDVRMALEEAEGRGVPLLVYLSRDD